MKKTQKQKGKARASASISALGQRLKRLRLNAKMSLRDLEVASTVSRAMISKVERGEKSPTFRILVDLAKGLKVSTSVLIGAQPSSSNTEVIRKGERIRFRDKETGFERHLMSPEHADNRFELIMHIIPAGQSTGELPVYSTPTEKYIAVEEGEVQVRIGDEVYALREGDAMYFFLDRPYSLTNNSQKKCRYYMASVQR